MGCNQSSADAESKKWDKVLVKDRNESKQIFKLLLLGTGNSGKSTFCKQLTQIHDGGFTDDEFVESAKPIQDMIVTQMKTLLLTFQSAESADEEFKVDLPAELLVSAERVTNLSPEQSLAVIEDDIAMLWDHQIVKDAFINRTNLGIADSLPHFLDDLDRVKAADYRPTAQDILFARIPTTGLREDRFVIKGTTFRVFDVGGQRSERSKWIHCFESVHGVLFVASLSCYDQNLFEENDLNAMDEALELFGIVVNSRYFSRSSMILFLNKSDLFAEKIKHKPLTIAFPEYDGDNSLADTTGFITEQFKNCAAGKRKPDSIYAHITCATDQDQVEKVFDDVQHAVVTHALAHNGLI